MMPFSTLAWRLIGLGLISAVVTGLWLRGNSYAARVTTLERLVETVQAAATANAELARVQKATAQRIDAVTALNAKRKQDLRHQSEERRKAILHVRPEDDGPLAPVLRRQLDRLPEPPAATARDGASFADGAADSPSAHTGPL